MTIYINGIKASKKALCQLEKDSKSGKVKIFAKVTAKGNIAYRTEG